MALFDISRNLPWRGSSPRESSDRVALITGGSIGIGAACVREFLSAGWKVSVTALPGLELDRLASSGVLTTAGDITCSQVRETVVERTLRIYGRIDVLINNAGIGLYALPTEVTLDNFRRLLEVNVMAPLALSQLVIPVMSKQSSGTIVNIGSVGGIVSLPWAAAYSASKSALHALHDSLLRELRGGPVHLVKVCPGIVNTGFRKHVLGGVAPVAVRNLDRIVSPEAVAVRILRAIERRNRTVYIPRLGSLVRAGRLFGAVADGSLSWAAL